MTTGEPSSSAFASPVSFSGVLVTADSVEHLRESAPHKIEARFPRPLDRALLSEIAGVRVTSFDGCHVALEVTGAIGPVLKVIAEHDPLDVVCRHADLDELFLELYRGSDPKESSGAD